MSFVAQSQARVKAQKTAKVRVGLWDLVRAELARSRRIFTWGVIGATLIFIAYAIILANASILPGVVTELQWNGNALAWMHMYAGGFTVPLGLLTRATAQWCEQRWHQGGTAWRVVASHRVAGVRLVVLNLSALACQAALVTSVIGHALIVGSGWDSWDRYLLFAIYIRTVVTGICAWSMAVFHVPRVVSTGAAPALSFVWFVAGMVQVERNNRRILPWAWTARVPLPLLGAHGSSVLSKADSSVWDYPLLPRFLLTIGLTLAGIELAALCGASGGAGAPASSVSRLNRLPPGGRDAADDQSETVSAQSPEQALGARP